MIRSVATIVIVLFSLSVYSQTKAEVDSLISKANKVRLYDMDSAYSCYSLALDISKQMNDTTLIVKSNNGKAVCEKELGERIKALGTIIKSLQLLDYCDSMTRANTFMIAGHVYSRAFKYDKATDYYRKANKIFHAKKDSVGMSFTYSGLGIVQYDKGDFERALGSYLNADKYWASSNADQHADLWNNLGALFVEFQEWEKAEKYYVKALDHYTTTKSPSNISMVHYNLGELNMIRGDLDASLTNYQKSFDYAKESENIEDIVWSHYGLFEINEALKNYPDAIKHLETYHHLHDSIEKLQDKANIMELEVYHDKELQGKLIEVQELELLKEREALEKRTLQTRLLLAVVIFLVVLVILGVTFYLKIKKTNLELQSQKTMIEVKNKKIDKSLKEKVMLLKEVHHRVKNNLQIITSLLRLQGSQADNEIVRASLEDSQNRIRAISLVHNRLYQNDDEGQILFNTYIKDLWEEVSGIYNDSENPVEFKIEGNDLWLPIDTAVPLALILSELMTNSFKHAFNSTDKKYISTVIKCSASTNTIEVSDNGIGLPNDFSLSNSESLGMELITSLADQINATVNIGSGGSAGTHFKIEVPV